MDGINWSYDFLPGFPMHIFPFTVSGNRDSIHWHQYYEIGLCVNGRGKFVYMNKVYSVKKGDLFISNNFENHVAIGEDGEETEYIFLIFLPEFIAHPHGRQFDLSYLSFLKYNPLTFTNKIDAELPVAQRLYSLFNETLALYQGDEPFRRMELDIKVRQILLELSRHYAQNSEQEDTGDVLLHVKVQKAIKYLNIHYSETITIDRMAALLDMNPSYFRHLFKKSTQMSFKSYVTYLRLSQAQKLLIATNKSVSEIISEVGYSNISQFYTVFHKFAHMSPAEYRRQYRNGLD